MNLHTRNDANTPAPSDGGAVDPIIFEVIRHKLWSINEEGSATMIHVSGSPVVHASDYNFGIYTPEGEMAVVGVFLLSPIYTTHLAIKEFLAKFDDIGPDDVFIINDPFVGAQHVNDVQFCAPFFHDGKLVAWLGCMAHIIDLGGLDPGSWCPTATDLYQEGLRIPAGRIVRDGRVNQELWDVIVSNSRMPFTVANDFSAFLAGLRVGKQRLMELCDRYGSARVASVMQKSIATSEQQVRELLRSLPDGTFEHTAHLDRPTKGGTELLKIHCRMTKTCDRLLFDFDGSDEQSAAYGMSTRPSTEAAIAAVILCLLGSEIPWNHGLMRVVDFVGRDGLCVTAQPPMPVSGGAAGCNFVMMGAAAACLGKLVSFSEKYQNLAFGPSDGSWVLAQFGGKNQYGEAFATMYLDTLAWGGPAFSFRDGVDSGGSMIILAGGMQDVEQQEVSQPLRYLWRREVPDSGGPGRNRGGNGIEYALTPIDTDEVTGVLATHGVKQPLRTGLFGGLPGCVARYEIVRNSDLAKLEAAGTPIARLDRVGGQYEVLGAVSTNVEIARGDVVNVRMHNGGGYGDPLLREPSRVLRDVEGSNVTLQTAADIYGVVIAVDAVDVAGTEARRAKIREGRKSRMHPPRRTARAEASREVTDGAVPWGDSLLICHDGQAEPELFCAHCRGSLGTLGEDWHDNAGMVELETAELGPLVEVVDALVPRQYICPSCATSLWVEIGNAQHLSRSDFSSLNWESKPG
jgi:N-methylhydantoinase B